MSLITGKVLGISITLNPKKEILEYFRKYLKDGSWSGKKSLVIATPNPEQVVYADQHEWYERLLNQADVAVPDGIGVVWAINRQNLAKQITRIAGVDLMVYLTELAAKEGVSIGLIGGRGGVAVKALKCLQETYPKLKGWAEELGEIEDLGAGLDQETEEIAGKIRQTGTGVVFVGLGVPKQEVVIERLVRNSEAIRGLALTSFVEGKIRSDKQRPVRPVIFMSVGGAFDFLSGRIHRAPVFIRKIGFEWIWRLTVEPWRWRRQLALVKFVYLVLRER